LAYRLFRHYGSRARGRTVILKTDGTAVVVDYPVQYHLDSDPFTQAGWNNILFRDIQAVFLGGHEYVITDATAEQLAAQGVGGTIDGVSLPTNRLTMDQASFETSTANWMADYGTVTRTTSIAAHGAASLQCTHDDAGGTYMLAWSSGNPWPSGNPGLYPVTLGQTYTAIVHTRAATVARPIELLVIGYTVEGFQSGGGLGFFGAPGIVMNSTSAWTKLVATGTLPSDAVNARIRVGIDNSVQGMSLGEVHYIDKVGFYEGTATYWSPPV
jgi:hypothetical protein